MSTFELFELDLEEIGRKFLVDSTSASGLRWKIFHDGGKRKYQPGEVAGYLSHSGNERYGHKWLVSLGRSPSKGWAPRQVSRIVWALVNGPIPDGLRVDHKNGIPTDNRIENLCLKSHGHNVRCRNKRMLTNSSGYTGVDWMKSESKWRVRLTRNGVCLMHKRFHKLEDAAKAYDEAVLRWSSENGEEVRDLNFPVIHG